MRRPAIKASPLVQIKFWNYRPLRLHPEIDPEVMEPDRRNLEISFTMVKPGRSADDPNACGREVWKQLVTTLGVDNSQYRGRCSSLHIADHRAALGTLRISPIGMPEARNAVFDVVQVQPPVSSRRIAKTLAFDDKLFAAPLRI